MAQFETWLTTDLQKMIKPVPLWGTVFAQDNQANLIGVRVYDGGDPATLGGSVSGKVIRADGATVSVSGTVSGNEASIVLPQAAYAVPGPVAIAIALVNGGAVTTLAACTAYVTRTSTDTVVDPGTIIPSIDALIAQIDEAIAAIPADYSAVLAAIASDFSASTAYAAGQYVWYNGTLYRFNADHAAGTWKGTDAAAVSLGGDVTSLKTAALADNLLYMMPGDWPGDRTIYGITYHYDRSTDSFQVSGTNTGTANYRFLPTTEPFPYYVRPGEALFVKFSTTDPSIRFEVSWKVSGSWVYNSIFRDTVVTIPENATGIGLRMVIYARVAVSGTVKVRLTREIPQDTDILQYLGHFVVNQNTVVNGVTWRYDSAAKTFTASGTATDNSFMAFQPASPPVSALIEKGAAYALKYSSTDPLIKVQFIYARNGQTSVYKDYSADSLIVIPEDVDAVGVRMLVYQNATVNGTAAVSLTKCELPEAASDDEVQVYTEFEFSPGWYTVYGSLNNNAGQTLIHTNPVRVIPGHDYYMSIKYDRGTAWPEGAFFDSEMRFIQALLPADLTAYAYQTPNGDAGSTLTNYVPLYKFTAPAQACYFSYNATNNSGFKYMTYIASIPVYRHIDTGDLVLKKGDPVRAYFGKRKLCVIGPSTVMIDRLYRTGNFENNGGTQSQYVVGFQEYLMPYWADVVSYGYSSASYAKYDTADGAPADSIYTQIVTNQVDLSGYDDFLFVQSGNGFEREIGTVTSYSDLGSNTTYIGALRQIIDYIYQQNPQAKVYIQTMRRYSFQYASAANWARADLLNDEIRKMAAFIACPVIDMDKDSGFNQYTATRWSYDATSLTVGGHWNHIGSREVALTTRKAMIGF